METSSEKQSTKVATLHQAVSTNHFKNKILKEEINSNWQLCKEHEEAIDHVTSIVAKNEYLDTIQFVHVCITQLAQH
jgi:hypothetical protein